MNTNLSTNSFTLQIDSSNIPYLNETAKWGKFFSVLGFIFITLMLVFGFVFAFEGGSLNSNDLGTEFQELQLPEGTVGVIIAIYFLIIAALCFFPCLYLFKFSSNMQAALRNNDQVSLNASFKNLKSCFKFWGITTIIILSIYTIVIIFAILASAFI